MILESPLAIPADILHTLFGLVYPSEPILEKPLLMIEAF